LWPHKRRYPNIDKVRINLYIRHTENANTGKKNTTKELLMKFEISSNGEKTPNGGAI